MHTLQSSRLAWHNKNFIYFVLDILLSILVCFLTYKINSDGHTTNTILVWWVTMLFFWHASASQLKFFSQSYRHPVRLVLSVSVVSLVYFFVLRADYSIISLFLLSFTWAIGALWLRLMLVSFKPTQRVAGHPLVLDKLHKSNKFLKIEAANPLDLNLDSFDCAVFDPEFNYHQDWQNFFVHLSTAGIPVFSLSELQELIYGKVPVELLQESWIEQSFVVNRFYLKFKRLIDIFVTLVCAPFIILLSLLISLAIKLVMGGDVLFSQKRVGLGGKEFIIYKFRTMDSNIFTSGQEAQETMGNLDPRITKLGRVLRLFRLDELPQFYNIIRGEMSLIGPRPEWLHTARQFSREIPLYQLRHIVRPGITGWAQVQQGHTTGVNGNYEKLRYDLFYIKHCSVWVDLRIVILTIKTLVFGKGV